MGFSLNKSLFVEEWWKECLRNGTQLTVARSGGYRPLNDRTPWKRKVANVLLYDEFTMWLDKNYALLNGMLSPQGFYTVFYSISSANRTYMRQGPDMPRVQSAHFGRLQEHRDAFNAKKRTGTVENTRMVE